MHEPHTFPPPQHGEIVGSVQGGVSARRFEPPTALVVAVAGVEGGLVVYGAEFPVAEPTLAVFWRWRGRERGRETAMSKFNKRVHKTQTGRDREGGQADRHTAAR